MGRKKVVKPKPAPKKKRVAKSKPAPKGRTIKCWATGVKGSTLDYYHAPDGHWYCNEAAYQEYDANRFYKQEIYAVLFDVLDLVDPMIVSPVILKMVYKSGGDLPLRIVYLTVLQCKKDIRWAMTHKTFVDDLNRAKYICAIIKNHMNDVYKAWLTEQKNAAIAEKHIESAIDTVEFETPTIKQQQKDISAFLGGDDE